MEKKVRIMLFDEEGRLVKDKLLDQDTEFYKGPGVKHTGPFRMEFTLEDQNDVEKVIKYISQLVGTLPLPEKKSKTLSKAGPIVPEFREKLADILTRYQGNQDEFIRALREEHGFVFLTWDHIQTIEHADTIDMQSNHGAKYEWMVKRLKLAKNPKADKYDLMLLIGIKLMNERHERVVIYLNGEHYKNVNIPVPEKPRETIKKTDLMKFPAAMIEEERDKFRFELRALQMNPEKEITKFFKRWRPFVENCPTIPQDKKVQE